MKKYIIIIGLAALGACNQKAKEHEEKIAALQHSLDSMKLEEEKAKVVEAPAPEQSVQQAPKKKKLSNTAKGALIGAGVGAVTGAVVSKKKGQGAVIGGLIGAGAGAAAGRATEKR